MAKPLILIHVEELVHAGIQQVVIVVQPEDLPAFTKLFKQPVRPENFHRLSQENQAYAKRILQLGDRVTFVTQQEQAGFGHAVACARRVVGDEPFVLVLGHHAYRSGAADGSSCVQQMLATYARQRRSVVGLKRTLEASVPKFGTVTGVWDGDSRDVLTLSRIAEKPTVEHARQQLRVGGLPPDEYLTVFGIYVVEPAIFDHLAYFREHAVRHAGEYQFTPALERLRKQTGLCGYVVDGQRFTIGRPEDYLVTLRHFGRA